MNCDDDTCPPDPNDDGNPTTDTSCSILPCSELLCMLYDAYISIISGRNRVDVSYGDRSVSYGRGNLVELRRAYQDLYIQCGDGSGLPELSDVKIGPKRRPYGVRVCNRG